MAQTTVQNNVKGVETFITDWLTFMDEERANFAALSTCENELFGTMQCCDLHKRVQARAEALHERANVLRATCTPECPTGDERNEAFYHETGFGVDNDWPVVGSQDWFELLMERSGATLPRIPYWWIDKGDRV